MQYLRWWIRGFLKGWREGFAGVEVARRKYHDSRKD